MRERGGRNAYLRFEVLGRVGVETKRTPPFQRGFEPLDGFRYVPFRRSEIP